MSATLLAEAPAPRRTRGPPARRPRRRSGRDLTLVAIVTVVSVVLFAIVGLPLLRIFVAALSSEGWDIVSSMLTDPVNRRILLNTVQLGVIVAISAPSSASCLPTHRSASSSAASGCCTSSPCCRSSRRRSRPRPQSSRSSAERDHQPGPARTRLDIYGLDGLVLVSRCVLPRGLHEPQGMLESLDPSLYEAAALLGASKGKVFFT